MESKTTETHHKLRGSNDHVRIIGQYLGQLVEWSAPYNGFVKPGERRTITSGNFSGIINNLKSYSILVKPLGEISNNDAMQAMVSQGFKNKNDFSIKTMLDCIEWDDGYDWGRVFFADLKFTAADYLRARGYAMPFGRWSVEQLVEFGIYKLIENGK